MLDILESWRNGALRYARLIVLAAVILFCFTACTMHQFSKQPESNQGDPFFVALKTFLELAPQDRDPAILTDYLGEFAIEEFDHLIGKFGSTRVMQAMRMYPETSLRDLLRTNGDDFLMVALHTTISAHNYLSVFNTCFGMDPQQLYETLERTQGRFTSALIILETIDIRRFTAIVQVFADVLPRDAVLKSFYSDPYLLASAIRIFAQRDPDGIELKKFMEFFLDSCSRAELFGEDLPGLVVAFSTIQEIKSGQKALWVKEFLNVTDQQLAQLIRQKPVDVAYVLFSGYRIGINNFKQVVNGIGKAHFRTALFEHTVWLADFLTGLKKITFLSSGADFNEVNAAQEVIETQYPFLLDYDAYMPTRIGMVMDVFDTLPKASDFWHRNDKAVRMRVYLLGLMAIYQNILYERMPQAMLSTLQFKLLKRQILCSTRFSENLDNMMSNFEVGRFMVQNSGMQTFILFLAHELAHQFYSISGFDAPLLSSASIHECSADIAAFSIAQRLGYTVGMREYGNKIIERDDYSADRRIGQGDLIYQGIPHKIGRTQLGYIMRGFEDSKVQLDWEVLFAATLTILRSRTKIKNISFVRDIIGAYTYCAANRAVSNAALHRFMGPYENSYAASVGEQKLQLADSRTVEEMILVAQISMLRQTAASRID
jgi:DNA-binding phage protein